MAACFQDSDVRTGQNGTEFYVARESLACAVKTQLFVATSENSEKVKIIQTEITHVRNEASVNAKLKTEEENVFQKEEMLDLPPFQKAPTEKSQPEDCQTLNSMLVVIKTEPEEVSLSVKSGGDKHLLKGNRDVEALPFCSCPCKKPQDQGYETESNGHHCEHVPGFEVVKTELDQRKIKCESSKGKPCTIQEDVPCQPPGWKTEPGVVEVASPYADANQQTRTQVWSLLPVDSQQMAELWGDNKNFSTGDRSQTPCQLSSANGNAYSSGERTPAKISSHREGRRGKCTPASRRHGEGNGPKSYSCSECGRTFPTSSSLHRHIRIHNRERPFQCSQCEKTFTQSKSFKLHQRIHTGEKPYTCAHCGKTFTRIDVLQIHQRTHTGEKPYLCSQCGKSFTRLDVFQNHQRTHTGEKPYQCSQCAKMFTRLDVYQNHQRIHTGEKPYLCSSCGKRFLNLSNLKNHQRTHTEERPYRCSWCDKTFIQSGHLTKHKKMHNAEKL